MNMQKLSFKEPKIRIAAFIVLGTLMGAVLWYNQIYTQRNDQLQTLKSTQLQKQNKLNAILAMKPRRDKLIEDIALNRVILDSLKSIFPDQKEIPKLIQDVTRLAHQSNIYTTKFQPLPDSIREYYVQNHYSVTMWGGYHEFAGFVSMLANLKLIVNLSQVNIKTHQYLTQPDNGASGRTGSPYSIVATFDLATFSSRR